MVLSHTHKGGVPTSNVETSKTKFSFLVWFYFYSVKVEVSYWNDFHSGFWQSRFVTLQRVGWLSQVIWCSLWKWNVVWVPPSDRLSEMLIWKTFWKSRKHSRSAGKRLHWLGCELKNRNSHCASIDSFILIDTCLSLFSSPSIIPNPFPEFFLFSEKPVF